ncbi:Dcp1-like decapping [Penicillium hispanicum]|uniref:Dcp1-like decapping n=1 Tax=Penicillium hispanicum TaxID=1080232 RepID=UPI0025425C54|nr:Dcp1-like decapping [Penicillium hispanicum]KAJ5573501.1 Dcp1-like decapping [Penicillium hispanicum]
MSSRKPRRSNNNHNNNSSHINNFTDYESDAAYLSDMQQQQPALPLRSNEELNLSVLRRHNPCIASILSLANYAVVYIFSPTTRQWEKTGVEGTLFVCQRTQGDLGEERYNAFVLNRRGLTNFDLPLRDSEDIELTEEYVILKTSESTQAELGQNGIADPVNPPQASQGTQQDGASTANVRIYGIWIYSEAAPNSTAEMRAVNSQLIRECAAHAGQSWKLARERLEAMRQNGMHIAAAAVESQAAPLEEVQASVPMGRQISLKDLFGQQRAIDDGWSVRAHHLGPLEQEQIYPGMIPQHQQQPSPVPQAQPDVLGDLFRRAGLAYQTGGQGY